MLMPPVQLLFAARCPCRILSVDAGHADVTDFCVLCQRRC